MPYKVLFTCTDAATAAQRNRKRRTASGIARSLFVTVEITSFRRSNRRNNRRTKNLRFPARGVDERGGA